MTLSGRLLGGALGLILGVASRAHAEAAPDDRHLAPLAPAPTVVASFGEARRRLTARSTDLRLAEATLARAEAQARAALAALLPGADAQVALTQDLLDEPLPGTTVTNPLGTARVGVSVPLVDVAAWRGRSAATLERTAARAGLDDARRRLEHELAETLLGVVTAERIAALNRSGLRLALERLALSEKSFALGAATELDVVRVKQDVAVARSALIAGDEQVRRAREALGLALGTPGEVGVAPSLEAADLVGQIGERCRPLAAPEERADLVAARAHEAAGRARVSQARAAYAPTLVLGSTLDLWTLDPGGVDERAWTLGAVLSLPLYDGGLRGATLSDREAAVRAAGAGTEATRRAALLEAARARRGQAVATDLLASATEARDLALRLDEMTRRSFAIGRATSVDLVQSASTLRLAELTLAQRALELVRARVAALLAEARCDA